MEWWVIPKAESIFSDRQGKMLSQEGHLQYGAVRFNALGIEQELKMALGDLTSGSQDLYQGAWHPHGTTATRGLGKRPVGMKRRNRNVLALKRAKEWDGPPDSPYIELIF